MKRRLPQLDAPIPRRRLLSAQEAELWHSTMYQHPMPVLPEVRISEGEGSSLSTSPVAKAVKKTPDSLPQALDGATQRRLRRSRLKIAATLDLHGMNVEAAYRALVQFIGRMQDDVSRMVLVITGKGRSPQSGILRSQLPHWLELSPLREKVGAFSSAHGVHGGGGAWYIRIRKRRRV